MEEKFGTDLTVGSIPRHLLRFSIPMLLGNLIQIGYSIINTIWVGHLVGEDAVGAAGVSFPIFFILVGFAMGVTMATMILVSQYYGAKDYGRVEKVVNNSFSLSLIIGAVLTIAAILSGDFLLGLMKTPPENFAMASSYLKIMLLGFILMYIGFLISSILRGIGDTVTPLIFMSIGVGLNAILDPFLIGGFGPFPRLGLNGAAYATLISQGTALGLGFVYLNRKNHLVAFNPKKFMLDRHITFLVFKIGLPSIIQQSLVSLGSIFVTTFVNSFGSAATNAFGAVARMDMFAFMPAMSMSMAVSALTGQNLGARKPERIKDIFKWGVITSSSITLLISLIAVFLSKIILIMFGLGNDAAVMQIGVTYLRIVGSCYVFFAVMFISNGIINGAGHTMITMIFSLLSLWLIRVPFSWLLSKTSLGITGIWVSIALSFVVVMIVSLSYYTSGRWKKSVVIKIPTAAPYGEQISSLYEIS
jgi:putative MATE family efflux protein